MSKSLIDYPKYQRFFNSCLREWYYQYGNGTNFYYANPPGILFTRLRSTKNVKEYYVLDDVYHWYFREKEEDSTKLKINQLQFNNKIFFDQVNGNLRSSKSSNVKSILHIGYDSWYSSIISQVSEDSYHVAFCNSYDVAFNTFYNYSRYIKFSHKQLIKFIRKFELDPNCTFNNLRLVTGNLYNIPQLLNSELFKCIVLHISPKNKKELLTNRIIYAFHDMLTPLGCIIVFTRYPEINSELKTFFPVTNGQQLWINRDLISENISEHEDSTIINILKKLNDNFRESEKDYNEKELLSSTYVSCFYKLKDNKPNKALKKSICTK